ADEIAKLRAHSKAMSFDEIYYPGIKVDTGELPQILQDYHDQFFYEGPPPDPTAPQDEKEPHDKAPPGVTAPGVATTGAEGTTQTKDEAPPAPRVPATVLGRLAWHHLIHGGWQNVADQYVFDTRVLTNHQPYFAAYIKVKDLLKFTDRLRLVQDGGGYLPPWAAPGIAAPVALPPR